MTRQRRAQSVPERVYGIAADVGIARYQGQALVPGLGDQQPVERVAMQERQMPDLERMCARLTGSS